jgi:hypothetical protein
MEVVAWEAGVVGSAWICVVWRAAEGFLTYVLDANQIGRSAILQHGVHDCLS